MKRVKQLAGLAGILTLIYSCANVGRLEGGPYDETPPRFITSSPLPGALNSHKKKVTLLFDEYIKLEKPNEKVVISPPQVQAPEIKTNGKKISISLKDSLKENTTYTVDFSDAIEDNNEGNPIEAFTYTFSTGDRLDSMEVSGYVLNAYDLEPVKGVLVGLHSNLADSAFVKLPFDRVGRTNGRGHFSIRGVAPGKYRIYALQDDDQNFYYSQPTEMLAFSDSIIVPSMTDAVRQDTVWGKDSLTIDTIIERGYIRYLPDDVILRSFKETNTQQRLARSERLLPHKFSLYFTAPADTLPTIKGLNFNELDAFIIEQGTRRNDTIHYWIKDSLIYRQDTLKMSLTYLYTDTLMQLVPRTDTLNLLVKQRRPEQNATQRNNTTQKGKTPTKKKKKGGEEPPQTPFLPVDIYAPASMDVYDYISLSFEEPLLQVNPQALHLKIKVDSLYEDVPFDFTQDSTDVKVYDIYTDWKPGEQYVFEMDSLAFQGLYGLYTDKAKKDIKVRTLEEYGQIFFNVTGADSTAYVELLNERDEVVRTVPLENGHADFYYLLPGKYGARLVNDTNHNGVWDTGSYEQKLQPESVYYYHQVIELKANFELVQDWNIKARSWEKQKPDTMKKQKPDEDKKKRRQQQMQNRNNAQGNRTRSSNNKY